jgi:hypothetical protein
MWLRTIVCTEFIFESNECSWKPLHNKIDISLIKHGWNAKAIYGTVENI